MTWPPVGPLGKLVLHQGRDGVGLKRVEARLHVRAAFEEGGETKILVAHWLPHARKWAHEVLCSWHLRLGFVWLHGRVPPDNAALIAEDADK